MLFILDMHLGGIKRSELRKEHLRAVGVTRLPFRLRMGASRRFRVILQNTGVDVWLRNQEVAPQDAADPFLDPAKEREYHTRAVVVVNRPNCDEQALQQIRDSYTESRRYESAGEHFYDPSDEGDFCRMQGDFVHEALWRVVASYYSIAGIARPVSGFNELRFASSMSANWSVLVICREDYSLSGQYLDELFALALAPAGRSSFRVRSNLDDFDEDITEDVQKAIDRSNEYVFYELALEAHRHLLLGDSRTALLTMLTALEAVHGALVRTVLSSRMPSGNKKSREKSEGAANDLLREAGIYKFNGITPYLFMKEAERPSPDVIDACQAAIQARNIVVHANPKIRTYSVFDYITHYEAVLRVYRHYLEALERTLDENGSSGE